MTHRPPKTAPSTPKHIPFLFGVLLLVLALDLHSTLIGISVRGESNPVINWLALHIGFVQALVGLKAIAVLTLIFFYRAWNSASRQLDTATAACLSFLILINSLIVANNYLKG